jgi:hypothetical protein
MITPRLLLIVVIFLFGCSASTADYDQWVKRYTTDPTTGWFPGPKGTAKNVQVPLKLVVTAVEGDAPQAMAQERQRSYGCEVAADGRVSFFYHDSFGHKGGGYPTIPDADLKRLDQLLLKLPDDGARLPPLGRRLVLRVPEGDHFHVWVYDRANAPDSVQDILRLTRSQIRSWMPEFKPETDVEVGRHENDGILALATDGELVSALMHGQLQFWDSNTHRKLQELPLPDGIVPQGIKFSPDGSLAVLTGWGSSNCCVMDTKTWKVLRDFQEPMVGRYGGKLYFPQFTADGHFLLFLCSQPDAEGHRTVLPRAYDTKTWERYDKLPGLPKKTLTCIESPKGKRAVILSEGNIVALWDSVRRCDYAKLDDDVEIHEVAFSPDESMVVMATKQNRAGQYQRNYRIRIWRTDTGKLVHELRPFEQDICENVVGLQWTRDGQYILASTKAHPMFDNCDINVWSVKSGRQRGNLSDGPCNPMGIVILPDESHVAAGGSGSKSFVIRFWDFCTAMKEIRIFEESFARPANEK